MSSPSPSRASESHTVPSTDDTYTQENTPYWAMCTRVYNYSDLWGKVFKASTVILTLPSNEIARAFFTHLSINLLGSHFLDLLQLGKDLLQFFLFLL